MVGGIGVARGPPLNAQDAQTPFGKVVNGGAACSGCMCMRV